MSDVSPSPQPFFERLSDGLQQLIQVVIGSHRKPPRRLRSLLNGTWFGHPLNPVITDVPITAWLLTVIFDILRLISPAHKSWAALGAFVTVIVGLLAVLGAIRQDSQTGAIPMALNGASASITRCSTRVRYH